MEPTYSKKIASLVEMLHCLWSEWEKAIPIILNETNNNIKWNKQYHFLVAHSKSLSNRFFDIPPLGDF